MKKFIDIFSKTLSWHIERLECSVEEHFRKLGGAIGPLGAEVVDLNAIEKALKSFKEELAERGEDISDTIKYLYEEIEYPLNKLKLLYENAQSDNEPIIDEKTAGIFAFFLKAKILELKEIAKEIIDC